MSDETNPFPSTEPTVSVLTPDDTWCMWIDSYGMRRYWATVVDETVVERDGTDTSPDEVLSWSVDLIEDETGKPFTVDHNVMLASMQRIVHERETFQLANTIIDHIAAVLDAEDHETATDELCQLDAVGNDTIIQVATLGHVIYG